MALHSITRSFTSLALAAGLAGLTDPASATVLKVDIDTSSLTGTAQLAFDLTDGDNAINNNMVKITAFSTTGSLGAASIQRFRACKRKIFVNSIA